MSTPTHGENRNNLKIDEKSTFEKLGGAGHRLRMMMGRRSNYQDARHMKMSYHIFPDENK